MLGPEWPEAVLPGRALYLLTFSHLLIVKKLVTKLLSRKLFLSFSLSLSLSRSQAVSHLSLGLSLVCKEPAVLGR